MRTLLSPRWIILFNIIPVILLFGLYGKDYYIINSLLSKESKNLWALYGSLLLLLTLLNLSYCIYLLRIRKLLPLSYGIVSFLTYTSFVYCYLFHSEALFPVSVPRWMISDLTSLYAGTFLMPTLVYSLIILVIRCTRHLQKRNEWLNLAAASAIPIWIYLFVQGILPVWNSSTIDDRFGKHFSIIFFVALTTAFLFFFFRAIYIFINKKNKWLRSRVLFWRFLSCILLPVTGLIVNKHYNNIFGDFTSSWFMLLTIATGLLLILPEKGGAPARLWLFYLRCFTFSFTLYFLLVFLPFLPLSLVAIVIAGTGLLMLAPVALFCTHVTVLYRQYIFLKSRYRFLFGKAFFACCILPLIITTVFFIERNQLRLALEYVYNPDYNKHYRIKNNFLANTLDAINRNRNNHSGSLAGEHIPYLSTLYNWIVLDNLSLSAEKEEQLRRIFFNQPAAEKNEAVSFGANSRVGISDLQVTSTFDNEKQQWESTVNLQLTNNSDQHLAEYITSFHIPPGCFVSGYYLYVGEKKERGILSEKRTAQWIFNQIYNENRDPGLLYYRNLQTLCLKVFPFAGKEVRKTGITFLHKDSLSLQIDGHTISLGTYDRLQAPEDTAAQNGYVSAAFKKQLPAVVRRHYYHFIVDRSASAAGADERYKNTLALLLEKTGAKDAKISFVGSTVSTVDGSAGWENDFDKISCKGGFFLERGLQQGLASAWKNSHPAYPVFVIITDSLENAVLDKDRSDLAFTFPEDGHYFVVNTRNTLKAYSLKDNREDSTVNSITVKPVAVLAYPGTPSPGAFLKNDNQPSIIPLPGKAADPFPVIPGDWHSALQLYQNHQLGFIQPILRENSWRTALKESFQSGILTPNTAYIVVETEAQKAALLQKQQAVINGNKNLDIGNEAQQMNEPGTVLLILLLLLLLYWSKRGNLLILLKKPF